MKLRYFYKIDHQKHPIPGSNIKRKSKPGNQWKEIDTCCNPLQVSCTCEWRYFVQLDAKGKPVNGSLIKRKDWPKMEEGINYQEIDWMNPCCLPQPTPPTPVQDPCLNQIVISDVIPAIITGGRNETYSYSFCDIIVDYGTAGSSQDVAIAVTQLFNDNIGTSTITGTFTANPDATITFVGNTCNCLDPQFIIQLLGGA